MTQLFHSSYMNIPPINPPIKARSSQPEATIEGMGRTGYRCFLEAPEPSSPLGT